MDKTQQNVVGISVDKIQTEMHNLLNAEADSLNSTNSTYGKNSE
jgi:hypothetical protein